MNSEAIIRKEMIMGKFRSKLTFIFGTGDLEDVESIIDFYEQKVNQLETNRDEAIEYINEGELTKLSRSCFDTHEVSFRNILSILERGKE